LGRDWFRLAAYALLAGALAIVAGCSSLAVRLGFRVRLNNVPVSAVSASLRNDAQPISALAPGQSAPLVIVATASDGKQYVTVGAGHGKVAFDNYKIDATVVQVSKSGKVSMPSDPRATGGRAGHLHIVPVSHPDVTTDLTVGVRYDIAFAADFSGRDGAPGFDGTNGLDGTAGTDGTPGVVDPKTGLPETPGPGGRGSDGGNGGDGSNGNPGFPGGKVHVWIRLFPGPRPLLQVKATADATSRLFLVDPHGGSLTIRANGGHGGRGGQGGRGGRGGAGGSGSPPGPSGLDGRPGFDGLPGADGAPGTITVSVDPQAQPYLSCLTFVNRSGSGSQGPAPQINVEPVADLW
jgi:hypothetical protein